MSWREPVQHWRRSPHWLQQWGRRPGWSSVPWSLMLSVCGKFKAMAVTHITWNPSAAIGPAATNVPGEVTLARLRLGHTSLTHKYLLSLNKIAPECEECRVPLTVNHILLDCCKFRRFRSPILQYISSLQISLSIPVLLGNDHPLLLKLLFKFLDDARLSDLIWIDYVALDIVSWLNKTTLLDPITTF